MSKLYLIASPLGNREDITLRALGLLRAIPVLYAEDTRELGKLLDLHAIDRAGRKIFSYASHNMKAATDKALETLAAGLDVGFVSDRGTPAISDPGYLLVREARRRGFDVVPIPGPSSPIAALSVSGFSADRFLFLGFLPTGKTDREKIFAKARDLAFPFCFLESPKRAHATLEEIAREFPEAEIFVAREMTKMHETFTAVSASGLDVSKIPELGEFTIVIQPGEAPAKPEAWKEELTLRLSSEKAWAKGIAERHGIAASEVYNALQKSKRDEE